MIRLNGVFSALCFFKNLEMIFFWCRDVSSLRPHHVICSSSSSSSLSFSFPGRFDGWRCLRLSLPDQYSSSLLLSVFRLRLLLVLLPLALACRRRSWPPLFILIFVFCSLRGFVLSSPSLSSSTSSKHHHPPSVTSSRRKTENFTSKWPRGRN